METDSHSKTAVTVAAVRAYHSTDSGLRIFDDPLANALLTRAEHEAFEKIAAEGLRRLNPALAETCSDASSFIYHAMRAGAGAAIALSRARYVEEALRSALDRDVCQYVIVGAGLDTFALRRKDLADRLRVFEIDHPATQLSKRERLRRAALPEPTNLYFVPADLEQESVSAALARTPYDVGVPSFFAWPGVTMYLTRNAVMATLRSIRSASSPGSELVFDYFDPRAFAADAPLRVRSVVYRAGQVGEPMLSGFDPSVLDSEIRSVGFQLVEDLGPSEIQARFLDRTDGFRAAEYWHLVRTFAQ